MLPYFSSLGPGFDGQSIVAIFLHVIRTSTWCHGQVEMCTAIKLCRLAEKKRFGLQVMAGIAQLEEEGNFEESVMYVCNYSLYPILCVYIYICICIYIIDM